MEWMGWRELLGHGSEYAIPVTNDISLLIVIEDSIGFVNWVFSYSWLSIWVNEREGMRIRDNRFCFWWMIREQEHRVIMRWENDYLRTGGNRWSRNSHHRIRFHWMIAEEYLVQSVTKWLLSRITEPNNLKSSPSPLKNVNEGRSIHSSFHSISLRIVSVFL